MILWYHSFISITQNASFGFYPSTTCKNMQLKIKRYRKGRDRQTEEGGKKRGSEIEGKIWYVDNCCVRK